MKQNENKPLVKAAEKQDEGKPHLLERYSRQPKEKESDSPYYKQQAPVIELPKGGGALKTIDEKFTVNAVNGTSSLEIALPLTAGRSNFTPGISLQYNSGSGNGEFGLGWALTIPSIQRKTDKRLPDYTDNDVFLLAGAEDLVPISDTEGNAKVLHVTEDTYTYTIWQYIPRIEGLYARVEKIIRDDAPVDVWWRITTKENIVTFYGLTPEARITDPTDSSRIFKWLAQFSYDRKGNVQLYSYKAEDLANVPLTALHEKNRFGEEILANTYLKRVFYCNKQPWSYVASNPLQPVLPDELQYLVQAVFDYGEHTETPDEETGEIIVSIVEECTWRCRKDPFSDFHAGFEVRTYRQCEKILVFHFFEELTGDVNEGHLVRSLDMQYHSRSQEAEYIEADTLIAITQSGYSFISDVIGEADAKSYSIKSMPPLTMDYNALQLNFDWQNVSEESIKNAPQGLTGPYQWIDLWGEGISGILTEQADAWFYKENNGSGNFSPVNQVLSKPSFQGLGNTMQWQDLDADGRRQVISRDSYAPGYFELDDDQQWQAFRVFDSNVNIDWDSPYTKMVDLNGDGRPDLLFADDKVWTWYENEGKAGFTIGGGYSAVFDEELGPRMILNDEIQTIFLADMNGDGMTDIVRIRHSEVCYWPNMGYGKFGKKIAMSNAPFFDSPNQFNPAYITVADISGTGAADILYLAHNKSSLFINLAGNAWSDAYNIPSFPGVEPFSKVAVIDLLGTGVPCIVWSSPLPQHAIAPMRYIDLTWGNKPYLLSAYYNGMGKGTTLEYTSSVTYYLADKQAGTPWATRLPFPVHCVSLMNVADSVSNTNYSQSYIYHHGYYDHEEREFRGFGRVDTIDLDQAQLSPVDSLSQDPVLTKTWYHTGAWMREKTLLDAFAEEYFDTDAWPMLPGIAKLPVGMTADEQREAYRALKGLPLRQEVYALDGDTELEAIPYTVTAFAYCTEMLQHRFDNKHAVFYTYQQHKVTYNCERIVTDPRISHELTIAVDPYGNVLRSAQVVYPRQLFPEGLPEVVEDAQKRMHIVYNENTYTAAIANDVETQHYLLPLPATKDTYELYLPDEELYPPGLWTINELMGILEGIGFEASDFSTPLDSEVILRTLSKARILYLSDDTTEELPLNIADPRALPYQQYTLAITPAMLNVYEAETTILTMLETSVVSGGPGYVLLDDDDTEGYWLPSGTAQYTSEAFPDPEETFFTPLSYTDPFNNITAVEYWGSYWLLPDKATDARGNITTVDSYDWRNLQPAQITDPNGNASQVLYDMLGLPVAMAMLGKGTGDVLAKSDGTSIVPDNATDIGLQEDFWEAATDPTTAAKALLGRATWRCIYNLHSAPAAVAMIARDFHYNSGGSTSSVLVRVTYTDGLGRVAMHKAQFAPDGATPRWVGSGKTVYNNKGSVVMQYEPFFSPTHTYTPAEAAEAVGVTPRMHYDPLGRLRRTDLPDASFTKTVWDAWRQEIWDNNDTLTPSDAWCTAHSGDPATVIKALAHAKTPTVMHFDTLARPFYTVQYLEAIDDTDPDTIHSYETLDIQGNRKMVTDGRAKDILAYQYDMLQAPLVQDSKDSGLKNMLLAVDGQPLYAAEMVTGTAVRSFFTAYDALRRPLRKDATTGSGTTVLERMVYGEDAGGTPASYNLLGQLYRHYDGAGIVTANAYDFKGSPLSTTRQFTTLYTTHPNWATIGSISMEVATYTTATQYDALSRPLKITTPDDGQTKYAYDKGGLLTNVELKGVRDLDTLVINTITYNAKGQRLVVSYQNGAVTEHEYDAETFRVIRIYTHSAIDDQLQDLNYFYDPVGNITRVHNDAVETVFFQNTIIDPDNDYTYDALYRLTIAMGREHAGGDAAPTSSDSARIDQNLPQQVTDTALRRYTQRYRYDEAGNMVRMRHVVGSTDTWTRDYTISSDNNHTTGNSIGSNTTTTETYTYDARGNITGGFNHLNTGTCMVYNDANRLETVLKNADIAEYYQYDGSGQRVRKVNFNDVGDIVKERKYIGSYEVYTETGGVADYKEETLHVMDDTTRVMLVETELDPADDSVVKQAQRYQFTNHLSTATLELDHDAKVISFEEYYPFGSTSFQSLGDDISQKRYRFTGKERDEMTGFYYHGARYYPPWLGRWIASDPLENKYAGISSYNYGFNNPITWSDPTGMGPEDGGGNGSGQTMVIRDPNAQAGFRDSNGDIRYGAANDVEVVGSKSTNQINLTGTNVPATDNTGRAPTTVPADKSNDPNYIRIGNQLLRLPEQHETGVDVYGKGYIGTQSQVRATVKGVNLQHSIALGQSLQGFLASIGYQFAGEKGAQLGSGVDQAMAASVALKEARTNSPFRRQPATTEQPVNKNINNKVNIEKAVWSQRTFNGQFSKWKGATLGGLTVDQVTLGLKIGLISPSNVPINVVARNGQIFILNTRSSAALTRAGIPRDSWNVVDQTGVPAFEQMLSDQLQRNNIPNGTNIIRQSGTIQTIINNNARN